MSAQSVLRTPLSERILLCRFVTASTLESTPILETIRRLDRAYNAVRIPLFSPFQEAEANSTVFGA